MRNSTVGYAIFPSKKAQKVYLTAVCFKGRFLWQGPIESRIYQ